MITFGDSRYLLKDFSGSSDAQNFCTVEKHLNDSTSKVCVYNVLGELLSEIHLQISGSDIEVNATFTRCIVYSYQMDAVVLINLQTGEVLRQMRCKDMYFMGFVNDSPLLQDSSGKVWKLSERTKQVPPPETSPPILAWASNGSVRILLDGEKRIAVQENDSKLLFSIPRRGMLCFEPDISIFSKSGHLLLVEPKGGVRVYSIHDQLCKIQLDSTEDISFEYAIYRDDDGELISIAHDMPSPKDSILYRTKPNQQVEIQRINFAPVRGHLFCGGRACANDARQLVML